METEVYEILTSIVYTNCEISSLIDILEEYSLDKAVNSKNFTDIYNLVCVIKEKHAKAAKQLGSLI